jgi:hypothetical protein
MSEITATVIITFTGLIQYYSDGVMANVVQNLGLEYRAEACIAVPWCWRKDERVELVWPNGIVTEHVVCDCSASEDYRRHIEKDIIAEVPYSVAKEYWPVPLAVGPIEGQIRLAFPKTGRRSSRRR